MEGRTTELINPRCTPKPKFLYYCIASQLHRLHLLTGEQSDHQIPGYAIRYSSKLSEMPGGSLLITGGCESYSDAAREVMKIETLREWAVSSQPPMHTARLSHATVYHSQYLYALGGYNHMQLRECERYVCDESRWEVLSDLLAVGYGMSAVEFDNSLYALGGWDHSHLDSVQMLSLDSLTWELMVFKLPQAASHFPCFKADTQVYLLINKTLYSFTPFQVIAVKTLNQGASESYSSYYSRGTLYYDAMCDKLESLAIGELTSQF
jgi:hypothetical protein